MTEAVAVSMISVLTPPGVGAIACLSIQGLRAWEIIRKHFRPGGRAELPDVPTPQRFWFGTFGREGQTGDEVILSVKPSGFELHCHGGVRVVRWIAGIFLEHGFVERPSQWNLDESPWALLSRSPTARTASVLLDQCQGAFRKALEQILADWPASSIECMNDNRNNEPPGLSRWDVEPVRSTGINPVAHYDGGSFGAMSQALQRLAVLAPLGRHLVEPWRVAIAGPPNVGKSSLLNALAGYTRSIVSPIQGTTRDVVTTVLAFDGWPVELCDTAGLHESVDALESAGIARAEEQLRLADLVLWVKDATEAYPVEPPGEIADIRRIIVWNKYDLSTRPLSGLAVSAQTRQGIPELIAAIVSRLVPHEPMPLEAVPYIPRLAVGIEQAWQATRTDNLDAARTSLAACLADVEINSGSK